MQNYILLLIGILVILLVGVIFYGWRKVTQLEIEISKNKYDVEALRNLISKMLDNQEDTEQPQPQMQTQNIMPSNFLDMQNVQMDLHKSFVNQSESFVENKSGGEDSITIESVETTETTGGLLSDSSDDEDDENVKVKVLESDEAVNIETDHEEDEEGNTETEHEEDENSEEEVELEVQNQDAVEESRVNSNDDKTSTEDEESDDEEEVENNNQELAKEDENKQEEEVEETENQNENVEEEQYEEAENKNENVEEDEQEEENNEEEVELEGENDLEDGSEDEEENMDEKIVQLQNEKVNLENRIADNIRRGGKKNVPNNAANQYSVGYEMVSENDGKMYMVVKTGKSKRWKLKNN